MAAERGCRQRMLLLLHALRALLLAVVWPLCSADASSPTGRLWGLSQHELDVLRNLGMQWAVSQCLKSPEAPFPELKALSVRMQLHQADFAEAWLSFPTGR